MSILRHFNKHHGWYDGKRTPYGGGGGFIEDIGSGISDVVSGVGDALSGVGDAIGQGVQDLGNGIGDVAQSIGQGVQDLGQGISQGVQDVGGWVQDAGQAVADAGSGVVQAVSDVGNSIGHAVEDVGSSVGQGLANFDAGVRQTIPGGWFTIGAIAAAAATYGASLSATSTAAAATDAAGLAAGGASTSEIATTLATNYGLDAATAQGMATTATSYTAVGAGTSAGTSVLSSMGLSPAVTNALVTIGQGSLTGAGMGGITAALTGGDIGKGLLTGAITGAVTGGANMGLSNLGPITAGIGAGAAGGAANTWLNGGNLLNNMLTGGAAGGMGNYLTGTQYANWARELGGATGGVVSGVLNGQNIIYNGIAGAALGGIGGMVANGVTSLTDPLIQQATLGTHVDSNGNTIYTADDGSTWTEDPSGKVIGSTPAFQTVTYDDGSQLVFDPTTGEIVTATDYNGNVVKSQDIPTWLQQQSAPRMNSADMTATTMAGTLSPKLSASMQKLVGNLVNKNSGTATANPAYGPLPPYATTKFNLSGLVNPGLNPGWMNQGVTPYYQTNNDVQSQYYWGAHPYMQNYNDLKNYNNTPAAPAVPWGIQQPAAKGPTAMNKPVVYDQNMQPVIPQVPQTSSQLTSQAALAPINNTPVNSGTLLPGGNEVNLPSAPVAPIQDSIVEYNPKAMDLDPVTGQPGWYTEMMRQQANPGTPVPQWYTDYMNPGGQTQGIGDLSPNAITPIVPVV